MRHCKQGSWCFRLTSSVYWLHFDVRERKYHTLRVYFSKPRNPTVRNKFSSCSGVKGDFLLLSNQTKGHVFWNSVGMRTQNRFTPQVRKTAFIVMNFLLQKEDNKSETKYAWDKGKMVGLSFLRVMRSFIFQVSSKPEYRLSTKM